MKWLALGSCLLCAVVAVWVVRHHTEKPQPAAVRSSIAPPAILPLPASASGIILRAGTVVSVTLADPINSDIDRFGKEYAASVDMIDGHMMAPGSGATVVMLNNNTGWLTQLTGLDVNGRYFQVLSGAGSVIAAEQDGNAGRPGGMLVQMGLAPAPAPTPNQRILLPPGTQLRFILLGGPIGLRAVAANRRYRSGASTGTEFGLARADAASRQEPEFSYLCRASDAADRALPISYYLADVFKTSDSQSLVERRWYEFLVATYPHKFANNHRVIAQCSRLAGSEKRVEPPANR